MTSRLGNMRGGAVPAIRPLSAEFADRRLERAYRSWIWPETTSALRIAASLVCTIYWLMLFVDYQFVGFSRAFLALIGIRVVITIGVVRLLRSSVSRRSLDPFADRFVQSLWTMPAIIAGVILTRPGDFTLYSISHIAFALGLYLMTPFRLPAVTAIVALSALTEIALRYEIGAVPASFLMPLSLGFLFANIGGYMTARRTNAMRRREFWNRLVERGTRRALLSEQHKLNREIAERRRIETELIAAKHEADSANNAKTAFLAAMSHDIRTPLTGILGFAQLLADSDLNDEQRAQLKIIEQSGRSLTRLLSDILDLSKIEAGHIVIESAPFDLINAIETPIRLAEPRARARGAALRFAHDPALRDLWVKGDGARVEQIIGNLIENAIKYAPEGDIEIHLEAPPGNGLCPARIAVMDRGPGVPDTLKTAIFEPYVLGQPRLAKGGFGLGLAICRRLSEAMGGTIVLEDRAGGGSIFTVTLTLERTSRDTGAAAAASRPAAVLDVLLVDDDEVNRLLIGTVIGRLGHRVESAGDGREGVERALSRRFDVVLMDMRMPEMDGMAAIAALRASADLHAKNLPIIALTANVMDQETATYRRAGADDVVAKPVDFKLLEEKLARLAAMKASTPS